MAESRSEERLCDVLHRAVHEAPGERVTLGEVVDGFGPRAYGMLMLVLGLPMALPVSAIPGVSTLFGVPLCIVCLQLAIGWAQPRLPDAIAARSLPRASLARVIDRAQPWLKKAERMTRPRWRWLTSRFAARLIGTICTVLAVIMALPIVGGNQPPGIAISLFGVGLLERDGFFVVLGLIGTIAALIILSAVLGTFAAAGYFLFVSLVH
jgi:hypothetical protein